MKQPYLNLALLIFSGTVSAQKNDYRLQLIGANYYGTIYEVSYLATINFLQTFTRDRFNYNVISTNPNEVKISDRYDGSNAHTSISAVTYK